MPVGTVINHPIKHAKISYSFTKHPDGWNAKELHSFLEYIGLSQYYEQFESKQVFGKMLSRLGDKELVSLGISSEVHRISLLTALQVLMTHKSDYLFLNAPVSAGVDEVCDWLRHHIACPEKYVKKIRDLGIHGAMLARLTNDRFWTHYVGISEHSLTNSILASMVELSLIHI